MDKNTNENSMTEELFKNIKIFNSLDISENKINIVNESPFLTIKNSIEFLKNNYELIYQENNYSKSNDAIYCILLEMLIKYSLINNYSNLTHKILLLSDNIISDISKKDNLNDLNKIDAFHLMFYNICCYIEKNNSENNHQTLFIRRQGLAAIYAIYKKAEYIKENKYNIEYYNNKPKRDLEKAQKEEEKKDKIRCHIGGLPKHLRSTTSNVYQEQKYIPKGILQDKNKPEWNFYFSKDCKFSTVKAESKKNANDRHVSFNALEHTKSVNNANDRHVSFVLPTDCMSSIALEHTKSVNNTNDRHVSFVLPIDCTPSHKNSANAAIKNETQAENTKMQKDLFNITSAQNRDIFSKKEEQSLNLD